MMDGFDDCDDDDDEDLSPMDAYGTGGPKHIHCYCFGLVDSMWHARRFQSQF
jgi:hypothetical protein